MAATYQLNFVRAAARAAVLRYTARLSIGPCFVAATLLWGSATAVHAQQPGTKLPKSEATRAVLDAPVAIDIPALPLAEALRRLGRQTPLQIRFDPELVAARKAPAVNGSMPPRQALDALLHGSGLEYLQSGAAVRVQRAAPTAQGDHELPEVKVQASTQPLPGELPKPYAGGQVARGAGLGLLGNTDIMDAPFNVTSYTAQTMRDQQAVTVADVLANDASVRATASSGGLLDSFFIRGFPINEGNFGEIAFDSVFGVAPTFRQFTDYAERLEVIKGPTALLNGIAPNSGVGGTINLVPKRALDVDLTRLSADHASDTQWGGHLDLSRRFGADREFGLRFNGSYHEGATPVANQSRQAPVGALALDYRGNRFRTTMDLLAQREHVTAPQRPLFPAAGITIPNAPDGRRNVQQPWERSKIEDAAGLVRAEYDLTETLTFFADVGRGATRVNRLFGTPTITDSAGAAVTTPQNFRFDIDRSTGDVGLRALFDTRGIGHSLTFQATRFHATLGRGFNSGAAQATNIFTPSARPRQDVPAPNGAPKISESEFVGIALADTLSILDERVLLTLGVRHQRIESANFNPTTRAVTSASDEGVVTPILGVVVKPWQRVSLYANRIEGLSVGDIAPAAASNAGEVLPPFRTKQIETGVKIDLGRTALTVSAFQIEKPFGQLDATTRVFSTAGEQRNRGLEVNLFGEPAPGVRLLAGATLLDAEVIRTAAAATRGKTPIGVPSTQWNVGGEWDLPFAAGLTVSGRVVHTSRQYADRANTQGIPSWRRLDLGARYLTKIAGKSAVFRASVQNALDRDYWSGVASFGTLAQGAPRTVLLSASVDF